MRDTRNVTEGRIFILLYFLHYFHTTLKIRVEQNVLILINFPFFSNFNTKIKTFFFFFAVLEVHVVIKVLERTHKSRRRVVFQCPTHNIHLCFRKRYVILIITPDIPWILCMCCVTYSYIIKYYLIKCLYELFDIGQ